MADTTTAWVRQGVVCHCYRQADEVIRIISARRADREETKPTNRHCGRVMWSAMRRASIPISRNMPVDETTNPQK